MKLAVISVSLVSLALISHADSSNALAANVTVNVSNFWFCSPSFQGGVVCPTAVKVGDTVTWNWVTGTHNTTSCPDGTFTNCTGQNWASPTQSSGTFVRQFNSLGTFYYLCTVHPTQMRGRIDVIQDTDNDGWSDGLETYIGTNPSVKCGANNWPPDITNDGFVDTGDLGRVTNDFGDAVPAAAPQRHDLAPDPPLAPPNAFIDTGDIGKVTAVFGQSCTP